MAGEPRRTRTDWPIVAAAGLITLLAAILLSAGPIYSSAASSAGLHRALADAPAAEVSIQVSLYSESGVAADVGGRVQGELQRVIAPVGGSIVRDWRGVSLLELPRLSGGEAGDQESSRSGTGCPTTRRWWPATGPRRVARAADPIPVVVVDCVATQLSLAVGDALTLVAHPFDQNLPVTLRVVGIVAVDGDRGPVLEREAQLTSGIVDNGHFRSFGPFFTTANDSSAARRRRIGPHAVAGLPGFRAAGRGRRRAAQEPSGGVARGA